MNGGVKEFNELESNSVLVREGRHIKCSLCAKTFTDHEISIHLSSHHKLTDLKANQIVESIKNSSESQFVCASFEAHEPPKKRGRKPKWSLEDYGIGHYANPKV